MRQEIKMGGVLSEIESASNRQGEKHDAANHGVRAREERCVRHEKIPKYAVDEWMNIIEGKVGPIDVEA
jgi:hypothetical protein